MSASRSNKKEAFVALFVVIVIAFYFLYSFHGKQVERLANDILNEEGFGAVNIIQVEYDFVDVISSRSSATLIVENKGKTALVEIKVVGRPALGGGFYGEISGADAMSISIISRGPKRSANNLGLSDAEEKTRSLKETPAEEKDEKKIDGYSSFEFKTRPELNKDLEFAVFRGCSGNGSMCRKRILLKGPLTDGASELVSTVLDEEQYVRDVCFDSSEGEIQSAIKLGGLLNRRGITTCISSSYTSDPYDPTQKATHSGSKCEDACVIAYLGGTERTFYHTGSGVPQEGTALGFPDLYAYSRDQSVSDKDLTKYLKDVAVTNDEFERLMEFIKSVGKEGRIYIDVNEI